MGNKTSQSNFDNSKLLLPKPPSKSITENFVNSDLNYPKAGNSYTNYDGLFLSNGKECEKGLKKCTKSVNLALK